MLGFEFMRNFNYPYIAKSVTEFWRRWHISLGTWFREYLYIPLGGNRVSKPRLFFNLLVVWAATGIWHGASWNFLIWGLYFAVLLILEKAFLGKLLQKLPCRPPAPIHPLSGAGELGHLRRGGLRPYGEPTSRPCSAWAAA